MMFSYRSNMKLIPSEPNTGIIFKRTDIENPIFIKDSIDNVVSTSRGTSLGVGDIIIHTVDRRRKSNLILFCRLPREVVGARVSENVFVGDPGRPLFSGFRMFYVDLCLGGFTWI